MARDGPLMAAKVAFACATLLKRASIASLRNPWTDVPCSRQLPKCSSTLMQDDPGAQEATNRDFPTDTARIGILQTH